MGSSGSDQPAIIDVWNAATFDDELRGDLDAHPEVIRDYFLTSRRQWLEREASDHIMPYPENPYAAEFLLVTEHIMRLMEERTIRAWHYTRMTDAEVDALRHGGIYPSTLDNIRARFATQVAAGAFTEAVADPLFADSPYQSDQRGSRSNKFWMVSHPVDIEDGGVELLLESWGRRIRLFLAARPGPPGAVEGYRHAARAGDRDAARLFPAQLFRGGGDRCDLCPDAWRKPG